MKVLSFLGKDFELLCRRLSTEVLNNNFEPDIVIGILTGGGIIGRISYDEFKKKIHDHEVFYTEVKLQRPSTKSKAKHNANGILSLFPRIILDLLRIIEVYYYEIKVRFIKPRREGTLNVDKNIELFLLEGGKKVLFIDDCIDTGYTLKIIEDHFKLKYPGNDYRIAVATVSHRHPVIQPDYQLYNRVLLRFPWANDVKKNEESCYC